MRLLLPKYSPPHSFTYYGTFSTKSKDVIKKQLWKVKKKHAEGVLGWVVFWEWFLRCLVIYGCTKGGRDLLCLFSAICPRWHFNYFFLKDYSTMLAKNQRLCRCISSKRHALHIINSKGIAYHYCESGYAACMLMRYNGGNAVLDDIHAEAWWYAIAFAMDKKSKSADLDFWHPQRESNSQLPLRRGLLYPFNYAGVYNISVVVRLL